MTKMTSPTTTTPTSLDYLEKLLQTGRKVRVIDVVHGQAHQERVQRVFEVLLHLSSVLLTVQRASSHSQRPLDSVRKTNVILVTRVNSCVLYRRSPLQRLSEQHISILSPSRSLSWLCASACV